MISFRMGVQLFPLASVGLLALGLGQTQVGGTQQYVATVTAWRDQQAKDLQASKGWLTVSGLFWLEEGKSRVGSAADNSFLLPKTAPAHLGTFTRTGKDVVFEADQPGRATSDGKPVTSLTMSSGELKVGPLSIDYIARGDRVGLRLYDDQSKALKVFKGLKWFPVQPKYRVLAKFTPYEKAKSVPITNVLGDVQMWASPGYVTFNLSKSSCKLIALASGDGLFFNFRDKTSGKSTYPAGRFLDAPKPSAGTVELDFNRATNPPCAFTAYATCPLPPAENLLNVAIPAGEKVYHPEE